MLHKSHIDEINVSLWFRGFECHPDEITEQLGIKPTEIRIKGEERWISKKQSAPLINKENRWRLRSELPQSVEPDKHLENILQKIRPHKEKFISLAKNYSADITFGIYWSYCNTAIVLDKNILKELAELNVEVGFDMYYLNELPEINVLLAAIFKNKIVKVKAGELIFKKEDIAEVMNEIEKLNAIILGLTFWQKNDDGNFIEINSTVWDDINSGKDAINFTVKAATELLKNGLPDNVDFVSFVL